MTPQLKDNTRVRHMLDAAKKAVKYTQGKNRLTLDSDEVLVLALTRLLEILGEAANGLSPEFRNLHLVP